MQKVVRIGDFKYKWMRGKHQVTKLRETDSDYLFSLNRALLRHDDIDRDVSWVIVRLSKNVFVLHKQFPEGYDQELLRKLGLY